MKFFTLFSVFLAMCLFTYPVVAKDKPLSEKDSVSYTIGTDIARSLDKIKDQIDFDMLVKGMRDRLTGKELLIQKEASREIMRKFSEKMMARQKLEASKAGAKNLAAGSKFLEKNKENKDVVVTASGLQYQVIKQGEGPQPVKTDKVKVHYKGTLINGTEFDSSFKRGKPASFPVTGVIKGWTEALLLMKTGSKYKLFIPPELAYGKVGSRPNIEPDSTLIFEVELLAIEK